MASPCLQRAEALQNGALFSFTQRQSREDILLPEEGYTEGTVGEGTVGTEEIL